MKLIVLFGLAALVSADESESFQQCLDQAINFKKCIGEQIKETTARNLEQLKAFQRDIGKCFAQDGVKGVCSPPSSPSRAQGFTPAAFTFPTPAPQFASCFAGAKNAFLTCFKKEAGLPEGFKPEGLSELNGPRRPPPFANQRNFPHETPEEIRAMILDLCGKNQDAADKLESCAKEVIKPYLPAMIATTKPVLVACQAAGVCAKAQPITADCKAKLEQGGKAFCTCRQEFPKYLDSSDDCAAARVAFKDRAEARVAVAQSAADSVAPHHDMPHHPDIPFDFCSQRPMTVCKELREKLEKVHAAFGLNAPTTPVPGA